MDSHVPWCIVSGFNVIYRSHFNKFGSRLTWQYFSAYAHLIYDFMLNCVCVCVCVCVCDGCNVCPITHAKLCELCSALKSWIRMVSSSSD